MNDTSKKNIKWNHTNCSVKPKEPENKEKNNEQMQ